MENKRVIVTEEIVSTARPKQRTGSVLVFNPGLLHLGGGERVTFNYAEELRKHGFNVTLAAPFLPSLEELEKKGYDVTFRMIRLKE
jgi:hypothetical protein